MSTEPSDERRAGGRRKEPTNAIRVFQIPSQELLGHVLDLSQTGMSLICELEQPTSGDPVEFKIQGPGIDPVCATVRGTIRWTKESEQKDSHTVGVEFDLHLSQANSDALAELAVLLCW